jgi:hypothetical protein
MNVDDFDALYGSKYIGVSDLKDREPRVTIRNVERQPNCARRMAARNASTC